MKARAPWAAKRSGKVLTSIVLPLGLRSSCQPGKVARTMKQKKEKTMAMMLVGVRKCADICR